MDAAAAFLAGVVDHADVRRQMSRDHFSVDGTLIDAWALMMSFRPKDESGGGDTGGDSAGGRNAERDFRGETRSNETHAPATDPDARLYISGIVVLGFLPRMTPSIPMSFINLAIVQRATSHLSRRI